MKDENGVEIVSPAIEEELDENGNPVIPSQEGNLVVDPEKEVDERGVELSNVSAENKRKQERIEALETQNNKLLDSLVEKNVEKPPVTIDTLGDNDYTGFEQVGMEKTTVNMVDDLIKRRLGEYDTKYVLPSERRAIERANLSEVKFIVREEETLAPYKKEIEDELKNMSIEEQSDPNAPYRAAELVQGRHVSDIVKKAKSDVRKELKNNGNRSIISNNPSGTTIKTDSGDVVLTAVEKAAADMAGISHERYAISKARHIAHKNKQHSVPGA